jgi:4-amino-4-deoxy-L-arabinose transferase-like glycosyltransferase
MAEHAHVLGLHDKRNRLWPIAAAGLLIVCTAVWLGFKIPNGILTYPDELLAAERAREMLILGRGSVHFNFHESFAKPPLQYWLTTLTLPRFSNSSTAVRLWPLVYGVLTAVAVGWLAFLLDPKRPWLIPLAVAIYVSCPLFSTEASRALLDTGLAFFTTLAVGFAQLARRHPAWWLGVAIACWLGALQKIPIIFLIWMIIVVIRLTTATERPSSGWLIGSALLAVALVLIWPLIQHAKYQMPLIRAFAGDEPSVLFGEKRLGSRPYFEVLDGLLASGWAGGSFAIFAAVTFVFLKQRDLAKPVTEISILSLAIVILSVILNFRSVRYVLPIVPCLSLVLAFFLCRLLEQSRKIRTGTIAFIVLFLLAGFIQAEIKMHHRGPDASNERRVAQKLGELQREGVFTVLLRSTEVKTPLRSNAFYLFHGNLHFPVERRRLEEFEKDPPPRPALGVCLARSFPKVQEVYPEAKVQLALDQFICWETAAPP